MNVIEVQSDRSGWDAYVQSVPGATSYHQFGWKEVVEKSFGHKGHYLAAIDDGGAWQGILPLIGMNGLFGNFLVSVPFVNYGGLLCSAAATGPLLREAERIREANNAEYVELRHMGPALAGLPTRQHKVTMVLELADDVESQWKGFGAKLRNQIRKAEKCGLSMTVGRGELLDSFYDVFARNMRDLGTPVYAQAFFRQILAVFPDSSRIFVVRLKEKAVAAGIAYWFGDTLEIPWASSIGDYRSLCPNNMLYWEAIQYAIRNGFRRFDFGRSTPGEGTFKFKEQWGAKPVQLNWQYLLRENAPMPELNPHNPRYRLAIKVWQRLPVALTRIIGPAIVKNIP